MCPTEQCKYHRWISQGKATQITVQTEKYSQMNQVLADVEITGQAFFISNVVPAGKSGFIKGAKQVHSLLFLLPRHDRLLLHRLLADDYSI